MWPIINQTKYQEGKKEKKAKLRYTFVFFLEKITFKVMKAISYEIKYPNTFI